MAQLDVIFTGYVGERVAGTVSLIRSGDLVAVVDPGMVPNRSAILDPLRDLGIAPEDVTDVILSHHHPDHTVNIALFPSVRIHDYWAVYERDIWTSRPADGVELADDVRLLETPGHTREDITTLVQTDNGIVALTHLWWHASAESDPRGSDLDALHLGRRRVLDIAQTIVPGHGAPFAVGPGTPA
ncbi:MAG TPA: MBL fold metallo-hydrolase [Acidimicrobiia bacterium]|jgi:glyoxylase-like metal-dependent hydrolase (beta-lactamase superfamily II)|nr:MBL fold metallo-hydrolase [Acidimicrobiia bacterium]